MDDFTSIEDVNLIRNRTTSTLFGQQRYRFCDVYRDKERPDDLHPFPRLLLVVVKML